MLSDILNASFFISLLAGMVRLATPILFRHWDSSLHSAPVF